MKTWQKYAAEFYGTFVLVGVGMGAILGVGALFGNLVTGLALQDIGALQNAGAEGKIVTVALAFGIGLMMALYTVGRISGGHFNPAVSLAMFLDRKISLQDMFAYWVAQVGGALLASLAYWWIISRDAVGAAYTHLNTQYVDEFGGFVGEAILTAVFVFAILVLSKSQAHTKYIGMGFALAGVHFVGIAFTGAGVNPARSFAPALVGGEWGAFWLYLAGPAVGAVIGWALYKVIMEGDVDFTDDLADIKDSVT
jgi:aquaporin Z